METGEQLARQIKEKAALTERYLHTVLEELPCPPLLKEAMAYSLFAGGKRLRPYLVFAFCSLAGGTDQDALPFAGAIEMVHTYSLIHDDLPCMDDDDLRRGKPASHIRFGEGNALQTGDALLNLAYESVCCGRANSETVKRALAVLGRKAGACGMVGGQILDISDTRRAEAAAIREINLKKTSALLEAACMMGCIAGGADQKAVSAAEQFGRALGLMFQLTDDLLDLRGEEKQLGKRTGNDEKQHKNTLVALLGIKEAEQMAQAEAKRAKDALSGFGEQAALLLLLTDLLLTRDH